MCKLSVIFLILLSVAARSTFAYTYTKCDLAANLKSRGFKNIADWVCLMQYESGLSTSATHKNTDGSVDYGLLQINDRYWCKGGRAGGDCKIDCYKLLDNSITDDLQCAQVIYKRHGFSAWYAWSSFCKGKVAGYLKGCPGTYP
jgi:lysozyme C